MLNNGNIFMFKCISIFTKNTIYMVVMSIKNGEQCNLYANLQFSINNIYMFDYKFAEASATWIEAAACGGSSCYLPVRL